MTTTRLKHIQHTTPSGPVRVCIEKITTMLSSYQPVSPFDVRMFRPALVKECIHAVLMEHLYNKEYQQETASEDTKLLVDIIKNKIKDLGYDRYKIVVQVYIGEQRGQAVKLSCRKFWDGDTDNFAVDTYMNETLLLPEFFTLLNPWKNYRKVSEFIIPLSDYDSLFCVAMAFGVYYY